MTYDEQLKTDEWQSLRKQILRRDKNICINCKNETFEVLYNIEILKKYRSNKENTICFKSNLNTYYLPSGVVPNKHLYRGYIKIIDSDKSVITALEEIDEVEEEYLQCLELSKYEKAKGGEYSTPLEWCKYRNIMQLQSINKNLALQLKGKPSHKNSSDFIQYTKITLPFENFNDYHFNYKNRKRVWLYAKGLHIHHKYYQIGKRAWEYPNEALVTLCWECHENLHKNEQVPYLDANGVEIGKLTPCSRCYGAGWFPEYNHIQNGICFKCSGAKYEEFIL